MRQGDRAAAAEFVTRYSSRIRRRIRGKLNQPMRRLFDSEEIFSTLSRRLDLYVGNRRMEASNEVELWSLVLRMAEHALIDKARLFQWLESTEGPDSDFARDMLARLRDAERVRGEDIEVEDEIERLVAMLTDSQQREIVLLWLNGHDFRLIGERFGVSEEYARKKWERARRLLLAKLNKRVSTDAQRMEARRAAERGSRP